MPPKKDKNPWSRSFINTPSPTSSDDENDYSTNRDNDLLAQLDLSRREDHAVVNETPFSVAARRAQARERQAAEPAPLRGSIATAEDAIKNGSQPADPPPPVAKKNDWRNNSGWTNAHGAPVPVASGITAGKSIPVKGTTTQVIKEPVFKRPAPEDFRPLPKRRKPRAKKTTTANQDKEKGKAKDSAKEKDKDKEKDKVQFGLLPKPSPEYPIIGGLERLKALPTKPKAPRKPTAKTKAKPQTKSPNPPSDQQSLDVHFLVTGGTKAQDVRKKARDDLAKSGITMENKKPSGSIKGNASVVISQYLYQSKGSSSKAPIIIDDDSPPLTASGSTHHTSELGTPPSTKRSNASKPNKPNLPSPSTGSISPVLVTPKPIPFATISQLEAMVENGYDLTMTPSSSIKNDLTVSSPPAVMGDSPPPQYMQTSYTSRAPGSSTTLYKPAPLRSTSPFVPWPSNFSPQPPFISPSQPLSSPIQRSSPPYRQEDSLPLTSYSSQSRINEGIHTGASSAPHIHSSQGSSQSRRSYPASSNSRWAALVEKNTDGEWSTIPPRRGRLTIRPQDSGPKSTSFRLPMNKFGSSRAGPSRDGYQGSPSPEETQTFTKVTVWAPTPQRPSSSQASADAGSSQTRGYVPPAMRALQQAASTTPRYAPLEPIPEPVEDEDDDWAAAWGRSANIALQRN